MNFSRLCLFPPLPPSPPAAGTACAPSICKMSALHPTVYPIAGRRYVKERSLWKLLLISLLKTVSGIFLVGHSCGSEILAECWHAKEEGLFAAKIRMPGICLCPCSSEGSAMLGAGYNVFPSTPGAPRENEPLASLISS